MQDPLHPAHDAASKAQGEGALCIGFGAGIDIGKHYSAAIIGVSEDEKLHTPNK